MTPCLWIVFFSTVDWSNTTANTKKTARGLWIYIKACLLALPQVCVLPFLLHNASADRLIVEYPEEDEAEKEEAEATRAEQRVT